LVLRSLWQLSISVLREKDEEVTVDGDVAPSFFRRI
jgi:hypothetical protein